MRALLLLFAMLFLVGAGSSASPAPGRIAFWSDRDGDPDVFTMNPDGSDAKNLGRPDWGDKRVSWSPDGKRIVYDSWFAGHREFDLWLMKADGTGKTQLTTAPERDILPAWSPDGDWIAFSRKRAAGQIEDLWLIHPDGTGERRIVRNASGPAWSPGGRRLIFASYRGGQAALYLADRDGRHLRRLTRGTFDEGVAAGAWSPNGRTILFTRWHVGGFSDVYRVDLRTGKARRLTFARADDYDASWSPDGKQIVFTSTRDRNPEVYVMNADGSRQRNVSRNPEADFADTWQPVRD